jgi:hypothetical protein
MTAAHRRGARREQQVADVLGTTRIKYRPRYQRSPDVIPIRFADGTVVVPESKTRKRLPKWLLAAVAQARAYVVGAVPCVVLSETGGEPLALVPLTDLAMLVGLRSPKDGEQLLLLGGPR